MVSKQLPEKPPCGNMLCPRQRPHKPQHLQGSQPMQDGANAKPLAELVGEMAAVMRQEIVGTHSPVLFQHAHQLQNLTFWRRCPAHRHRLAVRVAVAHAGLAAEDTIPISRRCVTVTPLLTIDFYTAMKNAGAQGPQELVDSPSPTPCSDVVHVQHYLNGRLTFLDNLT
eukprot:CAMPEP_0172816336 /NCGR_PEP_ID=MMETSP1075-20121228/12395_1 /TAXON_ID=2916 /ORGANISM="Ceratium fusus, Strain PA161109" /LENGTH=168 /DNA_ID=CAMNT_0013656309 /DNA_START=283 /DNA_END=790 /DNA_ORIENTATION=-